MSTMASKTSSGSSLLPPPPLLLLLLPLSKPRLLFLCCKPPMMPVPQETKEEGKKNPTRESPMDNLWTPFQNTPTPTPKINHNHEPLPLPQSLNCLTVTTARRYCSACVFIFMPGLIFLHQRQNLFPHVVQILHVGKR